MKGVNTSDIPMFCAGGIVSLMTLIGLGRVLWSRQIFGGARLLVAVALKLAKALNDADEDEMGLMVAERLRQQKVLNFRWACQVGCLVMSPLTALTMFNIYNGSSRLHTDVQDGAQLLVHAPCAVALLCPRAVSWRTIDLFYSIIALGFAAYVSPWACSSDTLTRAIMAVNFTMAILNLVRRAAVVVIFQNVPLAAVASSTIWHHRADGYVASPVIIMFIQVAFLAMIPACAYVLEASAWTSLRQDLEMQATKGMLSATSALLKSSYDVVVELDAAGTIIGAAQALASFLLRGSRNLLQGSKFSELISHDEDRELFLAKLGASPKSDEGLADAVHVRMRDGNGNTLRLELLWFDFRHVDGERRYMVGLREFSDGASPDKAPQPQALRGGGGVPQPRAAGGPDGGGRPAASASDEETASSSVSQTSSRAGAETFDEPMPMLTVNASRPGLPVLAHSTGFGSLVARLPQEARLKDLVKPWGDFSNWLQSAAVAVNDGRAPPAFDLTLRVPRGPIQARCSISPGACGGSADSGATLDPRRLRLEFSDIRRCGRGGDGRRGSAATPPQGRLRGTPVGRTSL